MSQVTEKWNKNGVPGPDEVLDRLYEIHNVDADDFYTNGKLDYSKALKNGVTHLVQAITYNQSDGVVLAAKFPLSPYLISFSICKKF